MSYVCAKYVSLLWSMCDVFGVLGIFCGVPREAQCIYINVFVSRSEVMAQMSLMVWGNVQGSFRVIAFGVASVFVHVVLRPGWGAWRCSPSTPRFFLRS